MTFFQVDDHFWSNRKIVAMIDGEGFVRASVGLALWTLAGSRSQDEGFDGVLSIAELTRCTADRAAARRGAALLVKYELWHAQGHECVSCPQPPANAWIFHQWFQFRYAKGDEVRTKEAKAKELREPRIIEAVWARDTDDAGVARCRYCARKVTRPPKGRGGDRKSPTIGWLDHIDPTLAIGPTNIVVTCQGCNQKKAQRTPEQAAMTLFPPPLRGPRINPESIGDQSGINPGINTESIREVSPPRARAHAGAGASGWGSGGVGPGSDEVTTGPAMGRGGEAPDVPVASEFGSPWHHHQGAPPSDEVIDQATCPVHDQPMPCGKCLREATR